MSEIDQLVLKPDSICPACASPVYGSLTRWWCTKGHGSEVCPDGTLKVLLTDSARSAVRLSDREVEVRYPCGHVSTFSRFDGQAFTEADVGEVLLSSCAHCEESP